MPSRPKKHRDMGYEYHYSIMRVSVCVSVCMSVNTLNLDLGSPKCNKTYHMRIPWMSLTKPKPLISLGIYPANIKVTS